VRRPAKVYLVGAGPGDPALITRRGHELMARADVLFVDDLVDPRLLAEARGRVVPAGKSHRRSQQDLVRAMVRQARRGRLVVRLKGGDPFIFGRGGEEAEGLRRARVPFEVVPGVTAANAASIYAGIPLTHRDYSSKVVLLTAQHGKGKGGIDFSTLPRDATLAMYMAVAALPRTVRALRQAGWPADTPAALIEQASQARQRTVAATLGTLVERASHLRPPALMLVGRVVRLRDRIRWFERRPLFGLKVMTTRAARSELDAMLEAEGAEVLHCPAVRIVPRRAWADGDYDWLAFTSATAVDLYFRELWRRGKDARAVAGRIAAVGPGTAEALEARGLRPDLVPRTFTTRALGEALARAGARRVLHPCADLASRDLHQKTLEVRDLALYKLARPSINGQFAVPDIIVFASAQTVRYFCGARRIPRGVKIVTIGPATSRAVRACGYRPAREARPHTFEGIVEAVRRCAHR
jgi:uroporphyrinogen III methyltransferase/synthase